VRNLNEYLVANSPREAVRLRRTADGKGCYLAGATDIMLERRNDLDFVVDLRDAGIDGVEAWEDGALFVGACATLRRLETDPMIRAYAGGALAEAAAACGNRPVRSTATIGGNLCSALPSADMAPVLLALDAEVHIFDGDDEDTLPLSGFFSGPRKTVLGDRLLTGFSLPSPEPGMVCISRKLRRTAEDISLAHVAVALDVADGKVKRAAVAMGAVAPTPRRAPEAEEILIGAAVDELGPVIAAAARAAAAAAAPIDDHRASAEYRRAMVEVLTHRLLSEAAGLENAPNEHAHGGAS